MPKCESKALFPQQRRVVLIRCLEDACNVVDRYRLEELLSAKPLEAFDAVLLGGQQVGQ